MGSMNRALVLVVDIGSACPVYRLAAQPYISSNELRWMATRFPSGLKTKIVSSAA